MRLLLNVIWLVFGGLSARSWATWSGSSWRWLALAHVVSAVALAITIIGIPLALADLKMIPISLAPLGKEIVPTTRGEFDGARR